MSSLPCQDYSMPPVDIESPASEPYFTNTATKQIVMAYPMPDGVWIVGAMDLSDRWAVDAQTFAATYAPLSPAAHAFVEAGRR